MFTCQTRLGFRIEDLRFYLEKYQVSNPLYQPCLVFGSAVELKPKK
jgi:hypothetical protein